MAFETAECPASVLRSPLSLQICCHLDHQALSCAELAGCHDGAVAACWQRLQEEALEEHSRRMMLTEVELSLGTRSPKEVLRELRRMVRCLAAFPASWAPCVERTADYTIRVNPRPASGEQPLEPAAQGLSPLGDAAQRPPKLAAVPLAICCPRGTAISAKVRIVAEDVAAVGEAIALGAEFSGSFEGYGSVVTMCFAPASGRVFVRMPGESEGLVAAALPPVGLGLGHQRLDVLMALSSTGCLLFGRQLLAGDGSQEGGIEWTGQLPPAFIPGWAKEQFSSLNFQVDMLKAPAEVSVEWMGAELPIYVGEQEEFSAVWECHAW